MSVEKALEEPETGQIRRGRKLSVVFLAVYVAVLTAIIAVGVDFDALQLKTLLRSVTPSLIAVMLALSCINYSIRAYRWVWLSDTLALDVPAHRSAVYYLSGYALGVTPGRVGEVIRLWHLKRLHGISYSLSIPLQIGDRVSDLLAVVCLALGAGLATRGASVTVILLALAIVFSTFLVLRHPGALISFLDVIYRVVGRFQRVFVAIQRSLRSGRALFSAKNSILAGTVSVVAWIAECLAFYLVLSALSADLPVITVVFVYTFSTLVGALFFLPGGLGGFEATAVFLLDRFGVDFGTAALATTMIRLTTLWFSVGLGSAALTFVMLKWVPNRE